MNKACFFFPQEDDTLFESITFSPDNKHLLILDHGGHLYYQPTACFRINQDNQRVDAFSYHSISDIYHLWIHSEARCIENTYQSWYVQEQQVGLPHSPSCYKKIGCCYDDQNDQYYVTIHAQPLLRMKDKPYAIGIPWKTLSVAIQKSK